MAEVNAKTMIAQLNDVCRNAFMAAAALCNSRSHYHVEIEHWLLSLLDGRDNDLSAAFGHYKIDPGRVRRELEAALDGFKAGSGRGSPDVSGDVLDLMFEAGQYRSQEFGGGKIRSGHALIALRTNRTLALRVEQHLPELARLPADRVEAELPDVLTASDSAENRDGDAPAGTPAAGPKEDSALAKFTIDMSGMAERGEIDPVVERDAEIRQVIDVLSRRRQNNPILVGEAGVGKTAVVEGLALRVAAGDVPESMKAVSIRSLDLGLLQAGAGVRGEFENRLKSVISEVKKSPRPIVLFVDEAHTLIGAGGSAGQGDAANLLKPALARGELRTIAATTFAEYKKFFEGDAALQRRFQQIRVDEPDEPRAVRMVRGLMAKLETHHGVRILDEGVTEAVRLTHRYIPDRQLPDKAISLLDTACARVALSQSTTPPAAEDLKREIELTEIEVRQLRREDAAGGGHAERIAELESRLTAAREDAAVLEERLAKEREAVAEIQRLRGELEAAADGDSVEATKAELVKQNEELKALQGERPLIFPVVNGEVVAEVVSGWTGIPLGRIVRDEVTMILSLEERLRERVVGQDYALGAISQRVRTSRAALSDPRRPVGVFLLVGPSGVGKTETAMTLASLLYGGDRNMVVVNMSEYKEEYKVSQLIGSPRGYEGSQEGGVLTEAVRRRPYSVVLLDEVEKAHNSVQEIFYQVFDKGMLTDSRGVDVDFKNTIILLTSNVGSQLTMGLMSDPETAPDAKGLAEALRPELLKSFKPALLGRMAVVPYVPLSDETLRSIIRLQLGKIADRLRDHHGAKFEYDPAVVETVAARCKEVESGARNVDHILTGTMLPAVSTEVLARLADGHPINEVRVGVDGKGEFEYAVN